MDPLDDLLEQLGDVEEEELQPLSKSDPDLELKEIDINTKEIEENEQISESILNKKNIDDSDDEELYIHKRNLTSDGIKLENLLKKNSSTSGATATDAWKTKKKSVLTGLTKKSTETSFSKDTSVNFDKFQISVRNPKVSSQNFGTFTAGMVLQKLSNLKPTSTFKEAWCTLGVIIEKGITKKSSNGNEYLIWKIHDLKDCQSQPIKLLMFGDSIKEHWKISLGTVIALMSPQIADDSSSNSNKSSSSVTLKVSKATHIVEIGQSAHFGTCKGTRQQDGQKCSNFVNTSLSEFCIYHVMSAARKLSAKRGTFNAISNGPNVGNLSFNKSSLTPINSPMFNRAAQKIGGTNPTTNSPNCLSESMRPAKSNSLVCSTKNLKTITKEEEKNVLDNILSERKNTFGARQIMKLKEKKIDKSAKMSEILEEFGKNREKNDESTLRNGKHASFGDFLKDEETKEKLKTVDLSMKPGISSTKMWPSSMLNAKKPMGARDAQEHAARLRAVALLKKKKKEAEANGGNKRKAESFGKAEEEGKAKKMKTDFEVKNQMEEIKKLLSRKSLHHAEAETAEVEKIKNHLNNLEEKEKVETFTTTCMAVKNVKVVTCNECKYTAQSTSAICIKENHKLIKHEAEKRFFKCSGCKHRTVCFEMMPIKHCSNCNENKWIRVAMKDERKVLLENENLLLRGEERTFVNS